MKKEDYLNEMVEFSKLGKKEKEGKLTPEIDWEFVKEMMKRMQKNKGKYPSYQWWHKKLSVEDLQDALARHFLDISLGEYEDEGDEHGHLIAIACNAMMIYRQLKNFS